MSKFVLIDHSLKGVGGHHFEYATHVLRAAQAAGFDVVLATHRKFRQHRSLPQSWRIYPLFRHHTYSKYAVYCFSRSRTIRHSHWKLEGVGEPASPESTVVSPLQRNWRQPLGTWWRGIGRRRRLAQFAHACDRLFRRVELNEGDHVFVPTLSEFDLQGLVQYLQVDSKSRLAHWHLQFHFDVFDGRRPEYSRQEDRRQQISRRFESALEQVKSHRLYFYNTSRSLAEQYNLLAVARFEALPYPVSPALAAPRDVRPSHAPLRITCGGAIRAEKGHQFLTGLAHELWDDYLKPRKLQLCVQSNKSWFRLPLPKGVESEIDGDSQSSASRIEPVIYAPHPLATAEYVELIRGSDIGLMMYDSRRYYARRAGVLCEFLCAGVPVVVPAGCWLAEQIAEPTFRHLELLAQNAPSAGRIDVDDVVWESKRSNSDCVEFGDREHAAQCELAVPNGAADLVVGFQWTEPAQAGMYIRLLSDQLDGRGESLKQWTSIVGRRDRGGRAGALVHLHPKARRLKVRWENAYDGAAIAVGDVRLQFLPANGAGGRHWPAGAVGLAAAEPSQACELLAEMVEHYPHYLHSAQQFSQPWAQDHSAARTVAQLLAKKQAAVHSPPNHHAA